MSRGRVTRSAHSDSSDVDADGTELEKAKLLRQYRIMDADRQAYSIQARQQLRKQQQEIEKLGAEQEELRHKLSACKSLSRQKRDKKDADSLQALMEQRDRLEEELEKETQHQKELQKEISKMEMKLKELRKENANTSDTQRSAHRQNQEAMRTLENKLQGVLTRFNEQLTKNSHLREELQTLHIERVRFQRLHDRLVQELQDLRKKTAEIITLSTAAHDARIILVVSACGSIELHRQWVEAQSKLAIMREKAEKELAQYSTEMRELERIISHESGLKDFFTTKYSEMLGQEGTDAASGLNEDGTTDSSKESPDDLETFFQKIQSITGEANPELLVSSFIQSEDRNFALFNFVNEQNNEAEALRDQINHIQEEMEHFQERRLRQEEDHHTRLRDVDARKTDVDLQTEDVESRAVVLRKVLDEVKTGVSSIVCKVECDMEDTISDNNIMPYLALVEQKTNQLLTIQAYLDNKEIGKDYNPSDLPKFLFGQNPETLQENITIQTAIQSVDYETDNSLVVDEEERPLSQGELRRRILEGVLQRENASLKSTTKSFKMSPRVLEETTMAQI